MKHARPDYAHIQDALGKIPVNEPVFLLRGQDSLAPATLRYYAERATEHRVGPELIKATHDQADAMEFWQLTHRQKLPDMPPADPSVPVDPNLYTHLSKIVEATCRACHPGFDRMPELLQLMTRTSTESMLRVAFAEAKKLEEM